MREGRLYIHGGRGTWGTGDVGDFFEFVPASGKPIRLRRFTLGISSQEEAEQLRVKILRGYTSAGNGGLETPRPVVSTDPAASYTSRLNSPADTPASGGSPVTLFEGACDIRDGLDLTFESDEMPWSTERLTISTGNNVVDAITVETMAIVEEMG